MNVCYSPSTIYVKKTFPKPLSIKFSVRLTRLKRFNAIRMGDKQLFLIKILCFALLKRPSGGQCCFVLLDALVILTTERIRSADIACCKDSFNEFYLLYVGLKAWPN